MTNSGLVAPVIAGLAAGIAFIIIFSFFSAPGNPPPPLNRNDRVVMTIANLKDAYRAGEPISFSVYTKGASGNLCNNPQISAVIISLEEGKPAWSTPPSFQTTMGCGIIQGIDREWRFGYKGEEMPYQSAFTFDKKYDNEIRIEKAGQYKLVAVFDGYTVEKEFVVSASSGNSISSATLPQGTIIGVQINDKGG
jgi:hypothetical protein